MDLEMVMVMGAGPEMVPITATFSSKDGFSISLEKEVRLGKLRAVLEEYGIKTDGWPSFLQNLTDVDVWLWQLDNRFDVVGSASVPAAGTHKISAISFQGKSPAWTMPADLANASITIASDSPTVTGVNVPSSYSLEVVGKELQLRQRMFTIIISGNYEKPLEFIKGILWFRSFTIGVSNGLAQQSDLGAACKEFGRRLADRFREQSATEGHASQMALPAAK